MIRAIVTIVLTCLVPTIAIAQACSSYPYNLNNGTTADASQVMANFNHVLNCTNNNQVLASLLRGWLGGLTMSNSVTSPNSFIDTAAGVANADDASTMMTLSAFTKNADAAWAVGSGNGCLDSGSALGNSTWYHLFVISRTDTGVVDQLCSTSATAPALPTSYTKKRRIGSFRTSASGNLSAFVQDGDYFRWKIVRLDVDVTNPGTAAVSRTLTVPTGVNVFAIFNASFSGGSNHGVYFSDLAANDEAPGSSSTTLLNVGGSSTNFTFTNVQIRTNTSAQIRTRLNVSDPDAILRISTQGWIDTRGRFQ